jgi:DNA-binding MarR family transcriptional regulator
MGAVASILFVDHHPAEAVPRARELAAQGREDAWEALDRHLRWHVVHWIQDRTEEVKALRGALLDAHHWAAREDKEPWRQRWSYLLEILQDAGQQPGLAADLEAVGSAEGRAAEILSILACRAKPLRPTDLKDETGLRIQQISNLGKKLEDAGLIVRRSGGRATWFLLTPRGSRLAGILGRPATVSTEEERSSDLAPELSLWNGSALEGPVAVN